MLSLLLPIVLLALLAVALERRFGDPELADWRRNLAASGAGFLGGVLLVAAWPKALDPRAFAATITAEGLEIVLPAFAIAVGAVALEVLLGAALILGLRRPMLLAAATALVVFFLALTGRAYWRFTQGIVSESSSCGCFGNLVERTPAQAFWQDIWLLVPGLLLAALALDRRPIERLRPVLVLALTAAAALFTWQSPGLPIDDLATRLSPGTTVDSVCTGSGDARICLPTLVRGLEEGSHLVVLTGLDEAAFLAEVESLNAHFLGGSGPTLEVVTAASPEATQAFFWTQGPAFDLREVPAPLIDPLYRTLPRSFLVEEGTVRSTWAGMPPLADLAGR